MLVFIKPESHATLKTQSYCRTSMYVQCVPLNFTDGQYNIGEAADTQHSIVTVAL
jgi:hypothetical protein